MDHRWFQLKKLKLKVYKDSNYLYQQQYHNMFNSQIIVRILTASFMLHYITLSSFQMPLTPKVTSGLICYMKLSDLLFMFLPLEVATGHQKFIDN